MRLSKPHDIEAFLKAPPAAIEAVVLHGADQGLVRERSRALERAILGEAPGPFQKIELTDAELRGHPARLNEEAGGITMLGGRKFIRVRCSADVAAGALAAFLRERDAGAPAPDGLLCFECGDLKATQALRKLAEGDKRTAGVLCAPDTPESLEDFIRLRMKSAGIAIEPTAVALLVERLAGDRAVASREIEKLETFMAAPVEGDPGSVTVSVVEDVVSGGASGTADLAVEAAFSGGLAELAAVLADLDSQSGDTAGRVLRAALVFTDRLGRRLAGQRAPMSYAQEQIVARIAGRWSPALAARARGMIIDALIAAAKPGSPSDEIAERTVLTIANAVRR